MRSNLVTGFQTQKNKGNTKIAKSIDRARSENKS